MAKRQGQVVGSISSTARPTRLQVFLWAGVVLLLAFVSLSNFQSYQLGTHSDDAAYVILARSLIASPTYGMVNDPGEPGRAKYPFGYPFILAPFLLLFPNNLGVLNVPSLVATLLITVVLFWKWPWFFPGKSYWWGLAVTGLFALNPLTIDHTRRVMSEPVFTLFSVLLILLTEQYVQGKRGWWRDLAMGAAILLVFYTRSIGIVLVVLAFLYLFMRIGRVFIVEMAKIAGIAAILAAIIVIATPVQWQDLIPIEYLKDENARFIVAFFNGEAGAAQTAQNPAPGNDGVAISPDLQARPSSFILTLFIFGIKQHFGSDLRVVAFPIGGGIREQGLADKLGLPDLPPLFGYLVSALVVVGMFLLLRKRPATLFLLFALVYFIAIFFWTWNDRRLLYPISAQIAFAFLASLEAIQNLGLWILKKINPRIHSTDIFLAVLTICLFAGSTYKSLLIEDSRIHAGDLQTRTEWLTAHAHPGDILMTEGPETDFIYSGLNTVEFPLPVPSIAQFTDFLHRRNVRFVLVAPQIAWQQQHSDTYSYPMMKYVTILDRMNGENQLQLIYSSATDAIKVYRVPQ